MSQTMTTRTRTVESLINDIHVGSAVEKLQELPANTIHTAITSPPYWQLRNYQESDAELDGTQIGLEDTVDEYIGNIAAVCDEIKRVLRDDGSFWLNIGDTYVDKDKQMIPQRVVCELQSRGWIVRNNVVWKKTNPVPQSVTDRLSTTTERLYHLVPSKEYYYDLDEIRDPCTTDRDMGKNPGDVMELSTASGRSEHCAPFPESLCEKPIQATTPPKVCADCGTPYERIAGRPCDQCGEFRPENSPHCPHCNAQNSDWESEREVDSSKRSDDFQASGRAVPRRESYDMKDRLIKPPTQMCDCSTCETLSGIVLDPFVGSGTACIVARNHGRRFIGIDINESYVAAAQKRIGIGVDDPEILRDDADMSLQSFM